MALTQFQALVTGAVMGALMRAPEFGVLIDVEPIMDGGDFTEKIKVTGRESGEELLIVVMTEAKLPPMNPLRAVDG